jgi:hypothetical protein
VRNIRSTVLVSRLSEYTLSVSTWITRTRRDNEQADFSLSKLAARSLLYLNIGHLAREYNILNYNVERQLGQPLDTRQQGPRSTLLERIDTRIRSLVLSWKRP